MIHDLSQALKAILEAEPPEPLDSIEIVFDRPDDKFNPSQTTINLFLYDIRENVELRSNEPSIERQDGKVIIHRPPLRIACSYLVTAWPVSGSGLPVQELPLQEHYLLSHVLSILSKYPTIPEEFLQGSLEGQEPPLPMITAQTEGFKNPAEFWTAIGNKMRPSFSVTVTLSFDIPTPELLPIPIVISRSIRLGQRASPKEPAASEEFHIGGQITDSNNSPVENATVLLVKLNIVTKTDADGRYKLGPMQSGAYKLHVQSGTVAPKEFDITVPAPSGSNYDLKLV